MRGGAKFGAVIALLLLHEGEPVARDALVDAIWGESPPPTADTALRGHVSKLRKLLEADPTVRLDTRGTGYALEVEPGRLDLRRFERSVDLGRSALGRGEFEDAERSSTRRWHSGGQSRSWKRSGQELAATCSGSSPPRARFAPT